MEGNDESTVRRHRQQVKWVNEFQMKSCVTGYGLLIKHFKFIRGINTPEMMFDVRGNQKQHIPTSQMRRKRRANSFENQMETFGNQFVSIII